MKKILKKLLGAALICTLLAASLCGCSQESTTDKEQKKESVTITFMNGDTKLGEATVESGETIPAEDYEKFQQVEGFEFLGWFATPTFIEASKKELTVDIFTENTTIYGSFKSLNAAEDTRAWYIVGESTLGTLADSAWAGADVEEAVRESFRLQPTGNATNEFSITLDLFEGDLFQIIYDWQWNGQHGFGYFTELDAAQMESGGGLGGSDATSNVSVLMSGNYTITLTTDPDNAAMDTIVVVRNGDTLSEGTEKEEEPFVVTDLTGIKVKGSWVADWSDVKELTRTEGTAEFTITMELEANTEICFMVYEDGVDTGIVLKESNVTDDASKALLAENGNNVQVLEAGSYTFTVDADTMTIKITK